jgi:hypothetical protein
LYRAPDGLFVNLEIVHQGYGRALTVFPFKYMELFRRHERAAREAEAWYRATLQAEAVGMLARPKGSTGSDRC